MLHGHLLGLYEKALSPQLSWEQRLKHTKQLGFDYIEISIDESDERIERLYWSEEQRMDLLQLSKSIKIPIRSMCLSAHRRFPFGSADNYLRKKAYELMERAILFAEDVGIHVIQLAGYDVYYEPSDKKSVEAFLEGMKWSAKIAEKHQVMLAMEIMDTSFLNSITKYLWFEKQIKSPWFKVYPDIGNLSAWGNDVEKELKIGINSIVAVHIKETKAVTETFPGKFKCVPFGQGCVDFEKCFSTLEQLKYKGPYLIEMWNDPKKDDSESIREAMEFVKDKYDMAMQKALIENV